MARSLRRARLAFLTRQPQLAALTVTHANFPMQATPNGRLQPGYRVEAMLAQDVVKSAVEALSRGLRGAQLKHEGWDRIVSVVREEAGEIDLKNTLARVLQALDDGSDVDTLGPPLPRLHIPQHLYRPLLLASTAQVSQVGDQLSLLDDQPVALRISPPPLNDGEARLVWDLHRVWERISRLPDWAEVDVVLLRNLAGVGVGLFAAEGFYPDFLLWLKRGKDQALAFVEPKGLRHQWPADKFELLDTVVPTWAFSVPVRGFVLTTNTEKELQAHQTGFSWSTAPACLLAQDLDGDYVESILRHLRTVMPAMP